jgi:hypothetical protein
LRAAFLKALVLFGAVLFVSTESLSVFAAIDRRSLSLCWSLAAAGAAIWFLRRRPVMDPRVVKRTRPDAVAIVCAAAVAAILALTALAAAFSPPNSADAMAYHMPRVVYWAEQSSVRFFPTQYYNQIMLQPFAEYLMLHTYVLTGGDRLVNFVQWFASAASIVGVSAVAERFGSRARGQAMAAVFCATLPSGILASSGAKNDYFLALWLIVSVYFALRFRGSAQWSDALYMGAALGFALFTKGTAYLFAPWLLLALSARKRLLRGAALALTIALAINAPQYLRNYDLSGSILGFDSAQGDGFFRWRNERFGWRETASNAIRNVSDQLGARSERWNQGVYHTAVYLHRSLGIDIDDPATTWRWSAFGPPVNANHEANAPNRWHLAVLAALAGWLLWRGDRDRALYAAALLCGFLAFCGYLKWQPFFARLLLPLFVLAAPLAGVVEEIGRRGIAQVALCLFLIDNARPALLENWVRPLKGPNSVFNAPRDRQYFADLGQWNDREAFLGAVDVLARSRCDTVGVDIAHLQIEYPIEALLRERNPRVRFLHTGVSNASARYAQPVTTAPCAVVCLDCAGDAVKTARYAAFPRTEIAGRFLVFMR